jgi:hypothetical protein
MVRPKSYVAVYTARKEAINETTRARRRFEQDGLSFGRIAKRSNLSTILLSPVVSEAIRRFSFAALSIRRMQRGLGAAFSDRTAWTRLQRCSSVSTLPKIKIGCRIMKCAEAGGRSLNGLQNRWSRGPDLNRGPDDYSSHIVVLVLKAFSLT